MGADCVLNVLAQFRNFQGDGQGVDVSFIDTKYDAK